MCVKCLLLEALAAADARVAAEPEQQPTNQSAAMGTDSGPGQPELSYDDRQDRAYGQVELDQARADVNVANAEAVRKLAHAAQILSNINEDSAVKRIVGMIEHLVPAIPEAEPAPEQPMPTDGPVPVPDDIEALAQQLANQLGIEVRVASFPRK